MSDNKMLREKLLYAPKHAYERITEEEKLASDEYCEGYKRFIDTARTERECVKLAVEIAKEAGFKELTRDMKVKAGDKVYSEVRGKALLLAVVGRRSLADGAHIAAAHVDSPRLDLKPMPMYEDSEIALLKTHYYGGIRKYQWVAIPLELRGVVALKDGSTVEVSVGKGENDPAFMISDLLPHLGSEQSKKPLGEAITGESLNIIIGSLPLKDDEGGDKVKLSILKILNEEYGICESDLMSAELEAVPALPVRDIGFDRSLIGGYGHDDRSCAYAELKAILELDNPEVTAVCILADKEEIGSDGISGMQSRAFETFVDRLCKAQGVSLEDCFERSFCISADVCNAFDPTYPEVSEKRNNAQLNYGVTVTKYTGARGKSSSNDASAEVVARVRRMFDSNGVIWQMGELGKVDAGGGGTVALYMANRNIDTIDAGVPVIAMHAPYELVSKLDCYMTYKGMKALYDEK